MFTTSKLTPPEVQVLLADWFDFCAREEGLDLSARGISGSTIVLGAQSSFHVEARRVSPPKYLKFRASDPAQQPVVDRVAIKARERVARSDFGGTVWYSTVATSVPFQLRGPTLASGLLMQTLSAQQRVLGWRRLGSTVLLNFTEPSAEGPSPFAPSTQVDVYIACRGPCPGPFAAFQAQVLAEVVGAICCFALGRSVNLQPIFDENPPEAQELDRKLSDPAILGLARKRVSLDIFSGSSLAGLAHFDRLRSALLTFESALAQDRDSVACILFTAAAEALSTPATPWRKTALTQRFVEFYEDLVPEALDLLLRHANLQQVFGIRPRRKGSPSLRRTLLEKIYDVRSMNLHAGLEPEFAYPGVHSSIHDVRRSLFLDFAESAILGYLSSPRSSLIGHPNVRPPRGFARE